MSLVAYQNTRFIGDVATNRGWRKFQDHVLQRLEHEIVPNLWHLCEYGWTEHVAETQEELQLMLDEKLYLDAPMKSTTANLLDLVKGMKRDAALVISDGFA